MARKRYETAFLPSSAHPCSQQRGSCDVDCLLQSISLRDPHPPPPSTSSSSKNSPLLCPTVGVGVGGILNAPLPLSEPLPQKKYSSSSVNRMDHSVSSLESIDSTKSEDNRVLRVNRPPLKLLSPISDKSPLDPPGPDFNLHHHHHHHHHGGVVNWPELTNVPWDMPKMKRRLALLGDSGISLDSGCGGGVGENSSCSSTAPPPPLRDNLQLNFDLPMDEYYEDPAPPPPPLPSSHQHQSSSSVGLNLKWTNAQVHREPSGSGSFNSKADRCKMKLDFGGLMMGFSNYEIDVEIELEAQEWFHGAITRTESEQILRDSKEGSFLVRNCESSSFNRYSLSLKSARGFIHLRIEPNSLGTFSLGESEFPSVSQLVLHFMNHRLPIKGAEHVKLLHPVITHLL